MLLDEFNEDIQVKRSTPSWAKSVIFLAVVWVALNLFGAVYMSLAKNIYYWDSATYWDISRAIASGAIKGEFWKSVYQSIGGMDYNYIAALPTTLWIKIFGQSRTAYVLGLINMYLMPSVVMLYIIACKLSKGKMTATGIVILVLPSLLFITVTGFADVGGLLPCLLCMYLYFTRNERKREIGRYVAIGALLLFAMLWRRWYAFFGVSFITAMAANAVIFKGRKMPVVISAATVGVLLLVFFRDFLINRLLADYGTMYSGYKFALSTDIKLVMRYFGAVTLVLLGAGSVYAGIVKKEKRSVFLWIQMIVCFAMFVSVQTHGQQHLLMYIPSLAVLALILIKHIDKPALLAVTAVVALINFANVFVLREQPGSIREIRHYALFPDFSMRPPVRDDVEEILVIKGMLDEVIEDGQTLGVLSSSFVLNEDILRNVEPSLGLKSNRTDYFCTIPQVDSRDTDMTALYNVNYMLVATPAQTHLAPENQKVITEAVNSFIAYADFATGYDELENFERTVGDITVKLYKRNRMITQQQMITFEKRLKN